MKNECRKSVLLVIIFAFQLSAFGQINTIDSLKQLLNTVSEPEQFQILTDLDYGFVVTNNELVIPIYKMYIKKAETTNNTLWLANLHEKISLAYYFNGKYDKNFEHGLIAVQLFDSMGYDLKLGIVLGELGYQMKRRNLPKAFDLMRKGKAIVESIKNKEQIAKIYDNYGVLHEMNNNYDSALFYYKSALKIKNELNDSIGLPYTLCNIYMALMLANNTDSAIHYLNQATNIRKQTNDKIGITECYSYYGDYYKQINDIERSNKNYKIALDQALQYNYPFLANQLFKGISENYETLGNHNKALHFYKLHKTYQDSIINEQTNKSIANLQVKYETTEKEKEIQRKNLELKAKSLQVLILIVLIVAIVLFFILIYSKYKQQQRAKFQKEIDAEKDLRFKEVIDTEEKERTRIAQELHDGLGQLLSTAKINLSGLEEVVPNEDMFLLENSIQLIDKSVSEVRGISHDLMPVSLMRYGLKSTLSEMAQHINDSGQIKVEADFAIEKRLNEKTERNIYRLVQELVNNIIKHANASFIQIQLRHHETGKINIRIENNGKTFNLDMLKNSKGIGWKNIYTRVNLLNGSIKISPGKLDGTKIIIQLNITDD